MLLNAKAGGLSLPVVDEMALVYETGVPANTLTFDVSAYTAARVVTWPDAAMTVAGLQVANVFTAAQMIDGSADAVQLTVQANGTQTNNLQVWESSAGTDLAWIDPVGGIHAGVISPSTTYTAGITGLIAQGANARNLVGVSAVADIYSNNSTTLTETPAAIRGLAQARNGATIATITAVRCLGTITNNNTAVTRMNLLHVYPPTSLPTGGSLQTCYGLVIEDNNQAATNYAIYTNAGLNRFGDKTTITQPSLTGAAPTLQLTQIDVSEEFVRFIGTSANGVLTQSIVENADVGAATLQGWLKVYVQDDGNQLTDQAYFVPIYTLA